MEPITAGNIDLYGRVFMEGVACLQRPFWVSAGTCIGLFRDGDFVIGDTDVDVAMIAWDGWERDIVSWLELEGFKVYGTYSSPTESLPTQVAFIKDGVIFDTYSHYLDGDDYISYGAAGKVVMPRSIYDNLLMIDTKYGPLPFPNPPEEYLRIRYGEDWKTPQDGKKPNFQ